MSEIELQQDMTLFGSHVMPKITKLKWTVVDSPGTFMVICKSDLRIDHDYQRNTNTNKVTAIARKWSWVACGVIIVALRDNAFWVIDGQHRVAAANQRSDITDLPCIVFETSGQKEEAQGFLTAQTMRKAVTAVEKHRALLMVGSRPSIVAQELIEASGRSMCSGGGPTSISCVARLTFCASTDEAALRHLWPLIIEVAAGESLTAVLLEGLLNIESRLIGGESLMNAKWRDRINKVGCKRLMEAASKSVAYHGKSGSKVWALGMEKAINRGLRYSLPMRDDEQFSD